MWLRACQGEKKGRAGAPEKGLHNVSTWVARWNSPTKLTGKSPSLKCSQSPTISHKHLQEKTSRVNRFAQQIGLNISLKKTEVMTLITQNLPSIQINGINIPTTEEFSYLGSTVRYDGGTGNDIKSWLNKASNTFRTMNNVWKSTKYSINTKLKLYKSCAITCLDNPRKYRETIITRRRWRWIGHIMWKEQDYITRTALHWTPEGRRKKGQP